MVLPNFLCTCLLSEYGKLQSLCFEVLLVNNKTINCVINIILVLNPKHSILLVKKKINSSPEKKKTKQDSKFALQNLIQEYFELTIAGK